MKRILALSLIMIFISTNISASSTVAIAGAVAASSAARKNARNGENARSYVGKEVIGCNFATRQSVSGQRIYYGCKICYGKWCSLETIRTFVDYVRYESGHPDAEIVSIDVYGSRIYYTWPDEDSK